MWLIKASLKNPYMVATIVFVILALGLYSLYRIPRDILPVFRTPAVQVLTYFQGMPADSIEKTITNRIERWVNQSPGAAEVTSKSVPGVSVVRIIFRDDVDPNAALTMTNALALGTLPTLPPNTLPPVVLPYDPTGTLPLGILTVENPSMDEAKIKDLARIDVRNMLGQVPGCVAPVVVGGKDRTILVYLDPRKMEARKVSPIDVVHAIKSNNMMVTPGTAYFGDTQVLLDTNMMVSKVKELNDFPIRTRPGDSVYLRDIGHAEDSYAIQTSRVRINGKRQVYIPIYRQQGASTLAVADGVSKHIKLMKEKLPPGTKLEFLMDQSFYVKKSIFALVTEGVMGAVLVSVMILIFLGNWRMTLIATMSIPLAILGAIACLYATGQTINVMTLGGLALGIGPLVDDAIVELENNHRNYSMGKSRIRAALDGCAEVMIPVMVATCTTNLVLAPLALIPGMGGFLFKPLALAVTFAMLTSFLLSRTFVPMMCAKFLPDEHRQNAALARHARQHAAHGHVPTGLFGRLHHQFELFLDQKVTGTYSHFLDWALRHRLPVLVTVGLLFLGSLCLTPFIGREFFPQADAGQITIYVRTPSDLRLDAAEARIEAIEEIINKTIKSEEEHGDRKTVVSEIGIDPDWSAAYTANSGQQDAVIRIQLTEEREHSAQEWAMKLREKFTQCAKDTLKHPKFRGLSFAFDTGGMVSTALNYGTSSPIDLEISGGTSEQSIQRFRLAGNIRDGINGRAGRARVKGAADVRLMQRHDAPYRVIAVDRQKAASQGLTGEDVILQVVAAINSSVAINRNFWIDVKSGNQYFVGVQFPEDPNMSLEDLLNVFATGTHQPNTVKLSGLVSITSRKGAVEITHTSLYPTYNVLINTENRDIGNVAKDVGKRLQELQDGAWREWELAGAQLKKPEQRRRPKELVDEHGYRFPLKDDQADGYTHARVAAAAEWEKAKEEPPGSNWNPGNWFAAGGEKKEELPPMMRVQLKGEYAKMNESAFFLVAGMAAAALLVYLLQVALFRSWAGPFVIMFTVPLGLIGVLSLLFVTHTSLNVQSEMGVIFLVGIAVNNGVLLVEFANKQRQTGMTAPQAIRAAAAIRFRPILMTFLATLLALIPMAYGIERGSEPNIPLGRAVVGGLLTSTVLTLFVVPIMYTLLIRDPLAPEVDLDAELADNPVETLDAHVDIPVTTMWVDDTEKSPASTTTLHGSVNQDPAN